MITAAGGNEELIPSQQSPLTDPVTVGGWRGFITDSVDWKFSCGTIR